MNKSIPIIGALGVLAGLGGGIYQASVDVHCADGQAYCEASWQDKSACEVIAHRNGAPDPSMKPCEVVCERVVDGGPACADASFRTRYPAMCGVIDDCSFVDPLCFDYRDGGDPCASDPPVGYDTWRALTCARRADTIEAWTCDPVISDGGCQASCAAQFRAENIDAVRALLEPRGATNEERVPGAATWSAP